MGAAMAPAAAQTIKNYLKNSNTKAEDYDVIYTGDLGRVGTQLLKELLKNEKIELNNHIDCGLVIFSDRQNVQSGASGCGCGATVLAADILPKLASGELNNILFVATGALMSPTSTMQGESIPSISHAISIEA
jgi:stage V sporulation protein AD